MSSFEWYRNYIYYLITFIITFLERNSGTRHYVKSVRIRSYSGLYFPVFGLNTKRDGVSLRIQSECEKIRTRITPSTDNFHTVYGVTLGPVNN